MLYRFGQPEYFSFHSSVFVVQEVRTGGAGRAKPARVRAREIARAAAPPAQCLDRPCARAPWRGARAPWRRKHRRVAARARRGGARTAAWPRGSGGRVGRAGLGMRVAPLARMPGRHANLISHTRARKRFRLLPTEALLSSLMAPLRSCRSGRRRAPGPARVLSRACTAPPAPPAASVEAAGRGMGGAGWGDGGLMCGGVDAAATTMRRLRSGAAGPGETGEKARTRIGSGAKPRRLI